MIKYVQSEIFDNNRRAMNDAMAEKILSWATETGLKIEGGGLIINPKTFEPIRIWYFESEEVKTLFLLRWINFE